jgi:hypothetical protein
MTAQHLRSIEAKAYVPSKDFPLAQRFYQDLGFTMEWATGEVALLRHGPCSFLLQNFHVADLANNFMMHLQVEDVDRWWAALQPVVLRYGVRCEAPSDKPWGMRDFALVDPSGVLWRIGQTL